jgi:hypothetical protein
MSKDNFVSQESKITNGNDNPYNEDLYEYSLSLFSKNEKKTYKKITKNKYCKILNNNELKLSELSYFEINIKYKNNDMNKIYVQHFFNKNDLEFDDYYVYKDEYIYIEFIKKNNNIECCCYIKNLKKNNLMFFTPPNY